MAKRRPTDKTQHQRLASTKSTRQERRQAARNDTKARRTVEMIPVGGFSQQDALALLALGLLVVVSYLPAMLWGGFVWDDSILIDAKPVQDISGLWQIWFSQRYRRRRALLAVGLYDLLAGAQAMGV